MCKGSCFKVGPGGNLNRGTCLNELQLEFTDPVTCKPLDCTSHLSWKASAMPCPANEYLQVLLSEKPSVSAAGIRGHKANMEPQSLCWDRSALHNTWLLQNTLAKGPYWN
eukprot:1146116-Pelagomonas_calceolata.AAC.6